MKALKFWQYRWWHLLVLGHAIAYDNITMPEVFDSECSCGMWWFRKDGIIE